MLHHTKERRHLTRQQVVGRFHSILGVRRKLLQLHRPALGIEPSLVSLVLNLLNSTLPKETVLICKKGVCCYPVQLLSVPERTERKLSMVPRNL